MQHKKVQHKIEQQEENMKSGKQSESWKEWNKEELQQRRESHMKQVQHEKKNMKRV